MTDQNRIMELQQELLVLRISDWYDKVISFQWFFLVFLIIISWIIWWKLVDRKNIVKIFCYGMLITVVSSFLNGVGLNLLLWSYPYRLLPFSPRIYITFSVLPVTYMLMYQYFRTWKSFATANTIMALVFSFILQPILNWIGMYTLINWSYFYSFVIYIAMGLGLRLLLHVIIQKEPMTIGNEKTITGIKKQPALVPPSLKRIKNKNNP